jgi:hypothetical protein
MFKIICLKDNNTDKKLTLNKNKDVDKFRKNEIVQIQICWSQSSSRHVYTHTLLVCV